MSPSGVRNPALVETKTSSRLTPSSAALQLVFQIAWRHTVALHHIFPAHHAPRKILLLEINARIRRHVAIRSEESRLGRDKDFFAINAIQCRAPVGLPDSLASYSGSAPHLPGASRPAQNTP